MSREYYDSATDYRWEVIRTDLDQRSVAVRFSPFDSADSARRPIIRSIPFAPGELTVSNLRSSIREISLSVIYAWNFGIAQNTRDNLISFQGLKGTETYSPIFADSVPEYNPLLFHLTDSYVESGGVTYQRYYLDSINDSARDFFRQSIAISMPNLWDKLQRTGHIDATMAEFGLDSLGSLSAEEVELLRGREVTFGDDIAIRLQNNVLSLNDSDMAAYMLFQSDSSVPFSNRPANIRFIDIPDDLS